MYSHKPTVFAYLNINLLLFIMNIFYPKSHCVINNVTMGRVNKGVELNYIRNFSRLQQIILC